MSAKSSPPAALIAFAEELRAHRSAAGMGQDELAAKVTYSASLIAMIETGKRNPSRDLAKRLDSVFGVPGTFARLEGRLRNVPFPASFRPFVAHEEEARSLRWYEHSIVPGLLQTERYARAVLSTRPDTTEEEIEELVEARLRRQDILNREEPPRLYILLDEAVLHRGVGESDLMSDQLAHLVEQSHRSYITIQVVPYSAGAHSGLLGAFVIAEVDDAPPIAYLETAAEGETVEEPSVVAHVALTFDTLRSDALPQGASRDVIVKVVQQRWTN
jgi:transcriptional regulator with XRE-family HTH domain